MEQSRVSFDRLDPRAVEKVSGPAWQAMRSAFFRLNEALLAVSPTARAELTTIYVKYAGPETRNQPYAVVWIKKASELTVGIALPPSVQSPHFVEAPPKCKYAGLTQYLVLTAEIPVPDEIDAWAQKAHDHVKTQQTTC
jgi:hypothetical protein